MFTAVNRKEVLCTIYTIISHKVYEAVINWCEQRRGTYGALREGDAVTAAAAAKTERKRRKG